MGEYYPVRGLENPFDQGEEEEEEEEKEEEEEEEESGDSSNGRGLRVPGYR